MDAKKKYKKRIEQLPNSISGDGKNWVLRLKQVLAELSGSFSDIEDIVDGTKPVEVNHVTGLALRELHVTDNNGMPQNNIEVTFDTTNVDKFASAKIWLAAGSDGNYQNIGSTAGTRYLIEDVKAKETYYVKVTAVNTTGSESDFDTAPSAYITIKGSVLIPNKPTQFYLTWDEKGPLWEWLYEDNGYVDFFELRLDAEAGTYTENLLDRTRNTFSRANPKVRSGTGYLFIRNIFGTYSQPAIHQFNKPAAQKPNKPLIIQLLYGVNIQMDALPKGFTGYKLVINGNDMYTTKNSIFTYYQVSGTVTVKYCFTDEVGDGEYSDVTTIKIKSVLNDIEIPQINYDKFDDKIKETIDKANLQDSINQTIKNDISGLNQNIGSTNTLIQNVGSDVNKIVAELNKLPADSSYTSIIKTNESIASVAANLKKTDAKVETNASKIEQTATEIKSFVNKRVDDANTQIRKDTTSLIQQESDKITTLVTEKETALNNKITANTSKIEQTSSDITVLVYTEKANLNGLIETNASQIQQNSNKITSLVADVKTMGDIVALNTSKIEQTATDLTSLVAKVDSVDGKATANASQIQQTANSITSVVNKLNGNYQDNEFKAISGLASAVNQTSDSITAVVTELNKDPAKSKYSAITMLKNGIDLSVKQDEVISRINLSKEGVTIDGRCLHITGDTVIDGKVIVGGNIKDGAVTAGKLGSGAVTADKLSSGAVTADKLGTGSVGSVAIANGAVIAEHVAANAITSAKIQANAITADKINAGAITSEKIQADAITADKLAVNSVNAEAIQAGSIIGQHISAGAVTTRELAVDSVDAQNIKSGSVTADKMNVNSLSAITATIGTLRTATSGARMEIKDNLIQIYDASNRLRVKMGVW